MVAKAVLNSFETMRYGQFVGGLPGGSSHFIRAVRSLLYLLSESLRHEGHRVSNLLIRHSGLNPYRICVEDDDWLAFDTLVVVFQMMQYFMQFTLLSNTNPFSGMGTFFLERTAEPWGRFQVSSQFCQFLRALLEAFVVPEEFENGNICTKYTTVYKYQKKLGYYAVPRRRRVPPQAPPVSQVPTRRRSEGVGRRPASPPWPPGGPPWPARPP